jgi:hyperosmotically inducible periplasmic protein
MKITKVTLAAVLALTVAFTSCKPKDADIEKSIQAKEAAGVAVTVKDHIVTLTGEVADEAAKTNAEKIAHDEKGVSSVVNNLTVRAAVVVAPPASVDAPLNDAAKQKVMDGFKDIKGVTVDFQGEKAVLTGSISKSDRMKAMQILSSANVKSDVSGLKDK